MCPLPANFFGVCLGGDTLIGVVTWGQKILLVMLAGVLLYAAPYLGQEDADGLSTLREDRDALAKKIRELRRELDGLESSARALRGGSTPEEQRLRDEELARIARDDLRMIGEREHVFELHFREGR